MSRRVQTVVVGAGPAGSCAALVLARAGRPVILLERERMPRYKTCGGAVVWRALHGLPCAPPGERDIPLLRVHRITVHHEGADPVAVERPWPIVTMVMRADFDRYLAERAAGAGAERLEGTALASIRRDGRDFVCGTTAGEIRCSFVVGADGAESRAARFLEAPGRNGARLGVALEAELLSRPRGAPPDARFDFAALPDGYGWVFPKRGGLSVGVFSRRGRLPSLRSIYGGYRGDRGLDAETEDRLSGHRIPTAPRRVRGRGGLVLAGDAAGLADPLTGEGISYAVRSGRGAAEAILRATAEPARAAAEYEREIAPLLAEIRLAGRLARLLYSLPGGSFRLFRRSRRFAEGVVGVFAGTRTYRDLVRGALRRPWRMVA